MGNCAQLCADRDVAEVKINKTANERFQQQHSKAEANMNAAAIRLEEIDAEMRKLVLESRKTRNGKPTRIQKITMKRLLVLRETQREVMELATRNYAEAHADRRHVDSVLGAAARVRARDQMMRDVRKLGIRPEAVVATLDRIEDDQADQEEFVDTVRGSLGGLSFISDEEMTEMVEDAFNADIGDAPSAPDGGIITYLETAVNGDKDKMLTSPERSERMFDLSRKVMPSAVEDQNEMGLAQSTSGGGVSALVEEFA